MDGMQPDEQGTNWPPWVEVTVELVSGSYGKLSNEELIMRGYEIDYDNRLDGDYYIMKEEE